MTIENERSHSPVHLHVDDATPVHVHVKKPKKVGHNDAAGGTQVAVSKNKTPAAYGSSNLRRSTASSAAHARSKSPVSSSVWVPPPGKSSKGAKQYAWQGHIARLEIAAQDAEAIQTTLRISDLSTDEEDQVHTTMRQYEKKIDGLMSEVGDLKSEVHGFNTEVELHRTLHDQEEELDTSRRALEEQERDLDECKRELRYTEAENDILRSTMRSPIRHGPSVKPSALKRSYSPSRREGEYLMKKLVEVEMDGQAAAKQTASLRDTISRLKLEKRLSMSDSSLIAKQKTLLMEKLGNFEVANHGLRKLLRDRHEQEAAALRLAEQRDLLLAKLSETEDTNQCLKTELLERDRSNNDLHLQMEAQKEENVAMTSIKSTLESNRAHLQKQLRQKDGDCNRMAVQIRNLRSESSLRKEEIGTLENVKNSDRDEHMSQMNRVDAAVAQLRYELMESNQRTQAIETQLAQERIEVDHLQGLLRAAKEKAERDKEALKKATRVQKQRAARSEDAAESLNTQILERENFIGELRSEIQEALSQSDKLSKEKSQMQAENTALNMRVGELESIMSRVEDSCKKEVEAITAKLQEKTTEIGSVRLDSERLKTSITSMEDKHKEKEEEVVTLRTGLKQYETLVSEYRDQVNRSRQEADETMIQLEAQKRETSRVQKDGDSELDRVKTRLQCRLTELAPIPELLKTTELKLQDANEKLLAYEKRNTDNTKLISELTSKVEQQSDSITQVRDKMHSVMDENRGSLTRSELVERKLRELEEQNRDMLQTSARREECIHQLTIRLEEKNSETGNLSRQLESSLNDVRRLTETTKDKVAQKERSSQSRILDLESQLSAMRAENARIKRERDESERKFNSRLYDLKDRLEQSHSTNRSMQNYVQFLKSSYANVFGDSSALTGSAPPMNPMKTNFPY